MRRFCFARRSAWLMLAVSLVAGCASPPRTTRITVADFNAMAAEMSQSLLQSEALAQRGPTSKPWVITVDKVTNLSDDVMTASEQWAVMQRIAGSLPVQAMRKQKQVSFVLPRGRSDALLEAGETELPGNIRRTPTHMLHATFRSAARAQANRRSDLYFCVFELFDVAGGEPVWTDRFEYKRQARGEVWD